jgi:hypothetical protein
MIWVQGSISTLERLARLSIVDRILANPEIRAEKPYPAEPRDWWAKSTTGIEWNISLVRGPDVWAEGNRGQLAVIGGIDTGYEWDHPALINQYRGWNGATADHNYNWHDAIHTSASDCGADSPFPCDDHSHGTHTMGIMVGDDGGDNQIGLAPEAKWIGCRCMEEGHGTPATYTECLQWMVAPTDLNDLNPNPDLAPDVISNSWVCTVDEGCVRPIALLTVVENVRAAGIVVVASAGNSGPQCSSVESPLAIYDASFSVGSTTDADDISLFSSRGPVTVDGSARLKPDICAPGQGVYSCVLNGQYASYSGTSMAGPHVAGLVALLITTRPDYRGRVDELENFIRWSAVPLTTDAQDCGEVSGFEVPNNTFGHGRIDAFAAHQLIEGFEVDIPDPVHVPSAVRLLPNSPNPFNPSTLIRYELPEPTAVSLQIYDVLGRPVRLLAKSTSQQAGSHAIRWDGQDQVGRNVPSGIYFYRLEADGVQRTGRMALVR